jgi:hypothetical protein
VSGSRDIPVQQDVSQDEGVCEERERDESRRRRCAAEAIRIQTLEIMTMPNLAS